MNLRIQITLTDQDGHTEIHPVDVEAVLPETGDMLIDNVEQEILRINRDVIRTTISAYLEELSKKARHAGGSDEGLVRTNAHLYAVDGEIGQFTFLTHAGIDATGQAWNTATHVFAALGPRESGIPKVGTACVASKRGGQKDGNEYCSLEIGSLPKRLKG